MDRANALAIAEKRGFKSDTELSTENLRNDLLRRKLDTDSVESINYGTLEDNLPVQTAPQNEPSLWDMGMAENTTAYSTQPSPELLNSLLNIPPSQLMASAGTAGQGQLEGLTAIGTGTIAPAESISTDAQAVKTTTPPPELKYGAMAKYRGIYSPEETKAIRDEFYKNYGESPSGFSMQMDKPLANAPKIIPRATAPQAQQPQDGLARYMQTWADPSVAAKAADKVAELMGAGFAYPEVEQVKNKRGEVGFKVKYPKRLTGEELAKANASGKPSDKDEKDLRQEYIGLTKDYKTVQSAWRAIKSAGERDPNALPSPASDMALIFAYMKLLDPNSTVREGEYATAQNATSIPGRVQNLYNNAKDGVILNDDQRNDFLGQAKKQYDARLNEYTSLKNTYTKLAKRKGFDPENVVLEFDITEKTPLGNDIQKQVNDKVKQVLSLPEGQEKEAAKKELIELRKQVENLNK